VQEKLHNLNIEKAVLSSIIFEPSCYEDVASILKSEDFYHPFHRSLFKAMHNLERKDLPIDSEFLKKELVKSGEYKEELFEEILLATPISNILAYSKEIKELSVKRRLIKLTTDIKSATIEEDLESDDLLDLVQKELYEISLDADVNDFRDSPEIVDSTLKHIEEMKAKSSGGVVGVDTGFSELNKLTSGFNDGDLIIIAARPSMGKTALTLNLAQKALDDSKGVAIFSLEMPAEQLMLRMLSAKTSIPLQNLRVGDMNDDEWSRLSSAMETISKQRLFVDDDGGLNIHQLRSKLRKLKTTHPEIALCVIDYLQLMSSGSTKDRHQEVAEISRGLKLLARELNIPIIALSQLNRSLESRSDKRPLMSDLRESGSIEQDADIIMFVYRDDVYRAREEAEKEKRAKDEGREYKSNFKAKLEEDAEIIIGKNRNGPLGTAHLIFQKSFTRFVDKGKVPLEIVYESAEVDAAKSKIDLPPM
jgi:replicative DNA helicase